MMILPHPQTEQPNSNQSSFGPSNQQSSFTGNKNLSPSSWNNPSNTGVTGWGNPTGNPSNTPAQMPALPWQQNSMQNSMSGQNSMSAPSQSQNAGHDGNFNGMNREQWRDSWMGSGMKDQAGTDSWLSQNGATKLANNGTFMTPFGEILDLGQNYRTGNVTPAWTNTNAGAVPMGMQAQQANLFGPSGQMNPAISQLFSQIFGQQIPGQQNPGELPLAAKVQQIQQPQNQSFGNPNLYANADQNNADISSFLSPRNSFMSSGFGA